MSRQRSGGREALEQQLRQVQAERERIKEAIRTAKGGAALPVLVEMLAETEETIRRLRDQLGARADAVGATIRAVPALAERALRDLRAVLGRDRERARALLAGLLGEIILWPDGDGLVAQIGTLPGVGVDPYGSGGRI